MCWNWKLQQWYRKWRLLSFDRRERDPTKICSIFFPRLLWEWLYLPDDQRGHVISSYNSDFLSGIFADIAKAASSEEESDPNLDVTLPSKKSRISLTKSISRCARSCANLAAVSPTPDQGRRLVTFDATKTHRASKKDLHHCVSNSSNEENSPFGNLAFPQLPSSVTTEPSTFTLTPKNQGQQPPATLETPSDSKDYGWFVEMDDECTGLSVNAYNNQSQKNLAFLAPYILLHTLHLLLRTLFYRYIPLYSSLLRNTSFFTWLHFATKANMLHPKRCGAKAESICHLACLSFAIVAYLLASPFACNTTLFKLNIFCINTSSIHTSYMNLVWI